MEEKVTPNEEIVNEATEQAEAEVSEELAPETEECEKASRGDKKKLKKAEAEIERLTALLADKEKELSEASDKYMRLYAEYDNFRRRTALEKEGIYSDAYVDALTQILPILDNMERAAQFSPEDAESPIAKGIALTVKSFAETLSKMGVEEIEALGAQFDPNLHNAVMHVDDEQYGENEIVEVLMKGYKRGDKVLRYSMVKVAN
ncbi:MAG: nucleotide exchange factor GrpE [Clostridia bacterium]|nr:nucleotide exchange factor GrpE [Clostridia bacterium]